MFVIKVKILQKFLKKPWVISLLGVAVLVIAGLILMPTTAQRDSVVYWKGKVTAEQRDKNTRSVRLLSGPQKGETITTTLNPLMNSLDMSTPDYPTGSTVFVSHNQSSAGSPYYAIVDYYRISAAFWIFMFVVALAVIFAGRRGFGALVGLVFSIIVVSQFLIPNVINGNAPYLITAIAIMVITIPGIFIAHGVNKRTNLALVSTYLALAIAVGLSVFAVAITKLTGVSDENIWLLSQLKPDLNIHGLLLCGLLISLVGILDDVTVAQTVAIHELHTANPKYSVRELYRAGLRIGREHIASLVNTLVLVYLGASFLFIAYLSVALPYPLIMILNSEFMMEEIIRALVGSASLILAVPITTIIAAYFLYPKARRPTAPSLHR